MIEKVITSGEMVKTFIIIYMFNSEYCVTEVKITDEQINQNELCTFTDEFSDKLQMMTSGEYTSTRFVQDMEIGDEGITESEDYRIIRVA